MTTQISKLRSRKIWLLWLAPLLVPALWFGQNYYEIHKKTVGADLSESQTSSSSVASSPADSLGFYERLAKLLENRPYTEKFEVTRNQVDQETYYYDCTIEYNRQKKTFSESCHHNFGANIFIWKNVADKALYAAAEAET